MKKGISESLRKIQCFVFGNLEFRIPRREIVRLKKIFLSVGSNTGQSGVTNVQRMRYVKIATSCS